MQSLSSSSMETKMDNQSSVVRIWDRERKRYCNGIAPAGKCDVEFNTGIIDRTGKPVFWHDRIAVFFGNHDRLLGIYDVDETFVLSFPYLGDNKYSVSLGFTGQNYSIEIVGNAHFEDKQKIKKFMKESLKYE